MKRLIGHAETMAVDSGGASASFAAAVCLLSAAVFAAPVDESAARAAAEAFVSRDAIGSAVLGGRTVEGLSARRNLWIVSLSPSGHIVMSGSDAANPIVGFSKNDFVEPDPESPAFSVLEGAGDSVAAVEAQGGGTRHARWTKLLSGGAAKKGLLKADNPPSETVIVEPFLLEHFDQCQPYNDYAPVYEPDTNRIEDIDALWYDLYRGRCPCGCVATAAAQMFHHFRWPARIDSTISFNHVFTDDTYVNHQFPVCFNGNIPIGWDDISTEYASNAGYKTDRAGDGSYWRVPIMELRGAVAESVRYPIARLILWCDVMAQMHFEPDNSVADYNRIASSMSDWYTSGRWVQVGPNVDYLQVRSDLLAGVPLQVVLDGHQVVAHGWASDGEENYIYLNYGWGGDNDGFYNLDNSTIDPYNDEYPIESVLVGHYPRAKPQIDPLPKVCGTSLTLNWHFPDFYTNNLSDFTVAISKTATTPSTFLDDFSASTGTSSSDLFAVGENSLGYDGKLLYALSNLGSSYFTFPEKYTLTSASVLTFRLRSYYALGNSFEVQARFGDGGWTTILAPELNARGDSGWSTESVYLGGHGGETVQLRLFKIFPGGSYYPNVNCILVDDFTVTDVFVPVAQGTQNVGKTARSLALAGLTAGATYSFTVTPDVSGAIVDGETSESVSTSIAGTRNTPTHGEQTSSSTVAWNTETLTALGMPEILSVSAVEEGFYGECWTNTTTFNVVCSNSVVSLEALPSHLSLVCDRDVSVSPLGNGKFKVCITPSGVNESNFRSRMILTLVGTDSNGTKCYKDLSLRFSPVEPAATEICVHATTSDGELYDVSIPYSWLESSGLVSQGSDAAAHEAALASDADFDNDGLPNWAEYVCGTSPTNSEDKLTVSITMENGRPVVTSSSGDGQLAGGFKAVIKGASDLSTAFSDWEVVTETRTSTCRFFRVEIVPDN